MIKKKILLFLCVKMGIMSLIFGADEMPARPVLQLKNEQATVILDLAGGSISKFIINEQNLNPLAWDSFKITEDAASTNAAAIAPRSMGHFLCLDRWGRPTDAEIANGMPFHGEATAVLWNVDAFPSSEGESISATMSAVLPMAGLSIQRTVQLQPDSSCFVVREVVTNNNKLGRIYNMVQHATIAPPFLNSDTVVDCNATRGFMQSATMPPPELPAVRWPMGLTLDGKESNLRFWNGQEKTRVGSYVIDAELGWITAANPSAGLLIGYCWKTEDYPWIEMWRHQENGEPTARGLEFGTTGLHQPYPVLVEKGSILGRPLFDYIDANESQTRHYVCFLIPISTDFKGVKHMDYTDGVLTLYIKSDPPGQVVSIQVGELEMLQN